MSRHLELQKKYSQNKKKESEKFSKDLGKPKVKITKGSTPTSTSTKVIRNKKLDVVIVSVNYNDYLSVTLSHNSKIFDNITVVTSSQDILCKKICEKFGVKYVVTDIMYDDNAKFKKGKAINEGLRSIENPDFILLIDADIIVSNKIDLDSIDEDYLYTSDRYICKSYNLLQSYINSEKKNEDIFKYESNHGIGFFQLFNINHNSIDKDKVYPEFSNDASWDDLLFRDKFPKRNTIDNTIIHLGDPYQNWTGRVTNRFLSNEELHLILSKKSTFTICSYLFNYNKDERQKINFKKFLSQFENYYERMVVGISSDCEIDFEIPCKVIKVENTENIWSKELIINKIVESIETDYILWIDGDIIFNNLDWLNNIDDVVENNDFVQLFDTINYLGKNGEILETHKSITSSKSNNIDNLLKEEYKPGGAWLGQTKILKEKKLFDQMYVGGGDTIFVYGINSITKGFTLEKIKEYNVDIWNNLIKWIKGLDNYKIGCLQETISHLYHGDLSDRNYNNRYIKLKGIDNLDKNVSLLYDEIEENKIVVYTSISGNYDLLKEVVEPEKNIEYICFTDQLIESKTWKIKKIPEILNNLEQTKKARCLKILPHLFLQEYETSVWVDGNIQVKRSIKKFINENLKNNFAIAKHPDRICVYKESEAVKDLKKDKHSIVDSQIEFYKESGYPEKNGMVQSGVIIRKHNEKDCIEICNDWWKELIRWSKRDQLSFNYSIYNKNMIIDIFNPSIISSEYFDYWTHKGQKAKLRNDYGTLKNYINGKEV